MHDGQQLFLPSAASYAPDCCIPADKVLGAAANSDIRTQHARLSHSLYCCLELLQLTSTYCRSLRLQVHGWLFEAELEALHTRRHMSDVQYISNAVLNCLRGQVESRLIGQGLD